MSSFSSSIACPSAFSLFPSFRIPSTACVARSSQQRNAPIASLYEDAILNEGAVISSSGALINFSGKKTGRSPKDKRIVYEDGSKDEIWWGPINIKME